MSHIPIYIICYNNGFMAKRTVEVIRSKNWNNPIFIIDNNSNSIKSQNDLKSINQAYDVYIHYLDNNYGPWVLFTLGCFEEVRSKPFFLTDPDLELDHLPNDALEVYYQLTIEFNASRVGPALSISDVDDIFDDPYYNMGIINWERRFWQRRIPHAQYELFRAEIDTTLFCYNPTGIRTRSENIRVGGAYQVRHLPWHKSYIDKLKYEDIHDYFCKNGGVSSISGIINKYVNKKIFEVAKNSKILKIYSDLQNDKFWSIDYMKNHDAIKYEAIERFGNNNKIFLDFGSWIGPTVLYASSHYSQVYAVDGDKKSLFHLENNIMINEIKNVIIIPKVIYKDNCNIHFGKNKFYRSSLNDGYSQITEPKNDSYQIEALTVNNFIQNYNINITEIGLIKLDIVGTEENILENLLNLCWENNIPLLVNFYLNYWNNPILLFNLSKTFKKFKTNLDDDIELEHFLFQNPFSCILFEKK